MASCQNGHANTDGQRTCTTCGVLMPPTLMRTAPTAPGEVAALPPKSLWRRLAPIVAGVLVAVGYLALQASDTGPKSSSTGGRSSMKITLDKCRFEDGWVEAGGFVTNTGSKKGNVLVNVSVDGLYVDRDYVYGLEPGQRTSWSISEPTTKSSGTCTAERG